MFFILLSEGQTIVLLLRHGRSLRVLLVARRLLLLGGEELDRAGDHLGNVSFLARLVGVLPVSHASGDKEGLPFPGPLLGELGQPLVANDVVPIGLLGHLGAVLQGVSPLGGGECEVGDLAAVLESPALGVLADETG